MNKNERVLRLCDDLRKADHDEDVRRAGEELRAHLREQQLLLEQKLIPYIEKAFPYFHIDLRLY